MVTETEEGTEGLRLSIQDLEDLFYADYGLVALTQPGRLQRASDALTGLFDRVGLRKNTRKTVSMACQTCHTPSMMLVEAYERLVMGKGKYF